MLHRKYLNMQQVITIGICVLATMTTRFLPFLIFPGKKETPRYIQYLGKALPAAIFGMLAGGTIGQIPTIAGVGTVITAFFMGLLIEFFNVKIARHLLK